MEDAQILVMGSVHFSVEPDTVNNQQKKILEVVDCLKEYEPTKIAVEKSFLLEEEINKRYELFQAGAFQPAYDEVEQFAFRIGKALSLPRLHAVDAQVDMDRPPLSQVFAWAKEYQPDLLKEIVEMQHELNQSRQKTDIMEKLKEVNRLEYGRRLQRLYWKLSQIGDRSHPLGVEWLNQWYHRDLTITANLLKLTEPGDRVLLWIGADHLHLIRQMLEDSNQVKIIHPSLFLDGSNKLAE
ncbi:DUF5694 domain-containing protein [Halobacillus sp. ACCC02827]|uniref:DUF5694 domain-containing protein n=1 Tax=Halobacillus sp. ACCC02827 TaxID=3052090 RepID=UPI002570DD65|nr:DUF5694 domain-containing protein [Halobacillus sp. ACCC02827]WJE16590.1 DUF5694 domain-containing protein [Halobacillus sp. ACCC02827]